MLGIRGRRCSKSGALTEKNTSCHIAPLLGIALSRRGATQSKLRHKDDGGWAAHTLWRFPCAMVHVN